MSSEVLSFNNASVSKKTAIALSGGVDSSVAALLLLKNGYRVDGIVGRMCDDETVCEDAQKVADKLGITLHILDLRVCFKEKIVDYFLNSYKAGNTPNPCIMCNKYIKWGEIARFAFENIHADVFATGHYANNIGGKLFPAKDSKKDQLYYLFNLEKSWLLKTLFPLSGFTKEEIKKIALEHDLPSKSAKESQDVCFTSNVKKFLSEHIKQSEGNIVHIESGKVIGRHNGYFLYTVGQRKGIGIAWNNPLYVIKTDATSNTVFVGEEDFLKYKSLTLNNINILDEIPSEVYVKIRYNMPFVEAAFDGKRVFFKNPQKGIAKGQACVFYDINDYHLLGGGFIE